MRITIDMQPFATLVAAADVFPLRVRYREEINGQIVHDSIHRRAGWTETYLLTLGGATAGFGSIAIGGPWKDKPTVFELYVLPAHRARAFDLFEALLTTSHAQFMEIQSNDPLLAVMLHTYAKNIWTEKIVFRDGFTTTLPADAAVLEQITPDAETSAVHRTAARRHRMAIACQSGRCDGGRKGRPHVPLQSALL